MNDNLSLMAEAIAEHRATLIRYSITALADLLTGQAPGITLNPEPLAALMQLIDQAGEQP